ncbi:MAG TPA: hypothetical protein PK833_07690, partial [Vicingus sp.]|nr:hypothetical protein [Vicingus sp.]
MNVLILHFPHPEGYPPTLNAISCISKIATNITILSTNTLPTKWNYPSNTELILFEGEHNRFKQAKWSWHKKIRSYFNYIFKINSLLKEKEIDLLIIYDNIPFLFFTIASLFRKKTFKIWYHSHDVYPVSRYKMFTLKWLSATIERKPLFFNYLDFFSLPAIERKVMFPLDTFKGKFFFIPNYPSKNFIDSKNSLTINENELRIVYPGSPSNKNGFKELIDVMGTKINSKTITLTIIGEVNPNYQTELFEYAKSKNITIQLRFVDRIPYTEMT